MEGITFFLFGVLFPLSLEKKETLQNCKIIVTLNFGVSGKKKKKIAIFPFYLEVKRIEEFCLIGQIIDSILPSFNCQWKLLVLFLQWDSQLKAAHCEIC